MDQLDDKQVKHLINDSILQTSDDFTDKIMAQITAQKQVVRKTTVYIVPVIILSIAVLVLSFFTNLSTLSYWGISVHLSPVFIFSFSVIFILIEVNRLWQLSRLFNTIK